MDVHISEQFVPPQFKIYDGTIDPEAHIKTFTNTMAFRTGNDAIWCRAFSLSLEGEALEWFNSLPPNAIENFAGLQHMFNRQFASSSTQHMFNRVGQPKPREGRNFKRVHGSLLEDRTTGKGFKPGTRPLILFACLKLGPFKDSVCQRAPKIMEELRERAADEIMEEEMKQSYKKEGPESKGDRTDEKKSDDQYGKPEGFKQREPPKGPRFQQYTPLNAPRARIFQEELSVDLIWEPKRRPTLPGADGNKHCLYHKTMGHTTKECVKDKIEELIRVGQLKKYVKIDRTEAPLQRPRSP
ncbi:uncharacterized protein LOC124846442 [Vigna umbellata]|uniref:uncharacterized protein LOC124846442 n=1 Tax=Vigna umbellata TaxID=87088 RepID=UPI001F5EE893|nr:uncharacterized protein LOC124846442 [Vigna umbellata]